MTRQRRLAQLDPASLTDDQRDLYDEIVGGRRSGGPQHFRIADDEGRLQGPFNAFLSAPTIGAPLAALGAAIRYESSLDDRAREIAILVVAAAWDSDFEQYAHEPIARAAGIDDHELASIRAGASADTTARWPDAADLTLVRVTRSLVDRGDLDDDLYAEAVDVLGEAGLFELTALVGYYAMLALQLRVFDVGVPGQ
ncbi:MAG: carboxymuconolactone decarboxylase family protein [Acidimicrobiales bacterium]